MSYTLFAYNGVFSGKDNSKKPLCKFIESIYKSRISLINQSTPHIFRTHQRPSIENNMLPKSNMKEFSFIFGDLFLMSQCSTCYNKKLENNSLCLGNIRIHALMFSSVTPNKS